jgi:hypothetical protein
MLHVLMFFVPSDLHHGSCKNNTDLSHGKKIQLCGVNEKYKNKLKVQIMHDSWCKSGDIENHPCNEKLNK